MPSAIDRTTISEIPSQSVTCVTPRRTILSAAALLALATPARASDPSADLELIELCADFDRLEQQLRALQDPLVERISKLRAVTVAGHVARARSLALWNGDLLNDAAGNTGAVLTAALVRDLLAGVAA